MGKGSSKAPKTYSPMEQAQAQDYLAQQEAARAETARVADEQRKANELTAQKATTAGDVSRFYGGGTDYLTQQLADLGFTDTYGIGKRFTDALDAAKMMVPVAATDVGSYFNYGNMFDTAKAGAQTTEQGRLDTALRQLTPGGWQDKYFANTADDPILNEILAQQKGELETTLQRKLGRGQMSQGAYDYALGQLGNLSEGAMGQLQDIGGGVLSGYRNQLSDLANAFSNEVSNYKLGQAVDPTAWGTQLTSKQGELQGGLRGDIMSALGGTQLFDPNALIAKAGSYAGTSNQPVYGSTPKGTGTVPLEETQRSTGTTGIF